MVGVGLLIGLIVGATMGRDLWFIGAAAGALVGWAISGRLKPDGRLTERLAALSSEVKDLSRRLAALETRLPALTQPSTAPSAPASSELAREPEPAPPVIVPVRIAEAIAATPTEAAVRAPATLPPESAAGPNPIVKWLLGGNTVVRVGVVILFFGVAFLLKYAYEHTHVPVEFRLVGAALGAVALLVLGWRLRQTRPGYALSLQGGGIGLLYLTIFAAFRLYALLPPLPAFVLLVAVAVFSASLAVLQNSLALAVIGASGGFLAPVLASTGQRQPRDALLVLPGAEPGNLRRRLAQVLARAQPRRLRLHLRHRHALGSHEVSAGPVRFHRTVPGRVFPAVRGHRRFCTRAARRSRSGTTSTARSSSACRWSPSGCRRAWCASSSMGPRGAPSLLARST